MPDLLSIAASVASLISLGIQVTQSLIDFYKSYSYQISELAVIIERLESLAKNLRYLEKALSSRTFQANEQNLVESIEKSIIHCKELVQELQDECKKFNETSSSGIKDAAKAANRCATYSFRQSTLQKLDKNITEIRANLFIALSVLQLNNNQRFQEDTSEIKVFLKSLRANQISLNLRD